MATNTPYQKPFGMDENKFRAKDLGLLFATERFLQQYGLEAEVKGSIIENPDPVQPRSYGDIDLLAKTEDPQRPVFALKRAQHGTRDPGIEIFPKGTTFRSNLGRERTEHYLHMRINNRFLINKGRSRIDLSIVDLKAAQAAIEKQLETTMKTVMSVGHNVVEWYLQERERMLAKYTL